MKTDREQKLLCLFSVLPDNIQKQILYEVEKQVIAYNPENENLSRDKQKKLRQAKLLATRPSEITDWEDVAPSEYE